MRDLLFAVSLTLLVACPAPQAPATPRVSLHRTGGNTFELTPMDGALPHCLAFTVAAGGLTRQLTMSRSNESFDCPAGATIGGHQYKVPLSDGPVQVLVLLTSQRVNAASVSQQLLDSRDISKLTAMDLRLPGKAALVVLPFEPRDEEPAQVGSVLGAVEDAGVAEAPAPAPAATAEPSDAGEVPSAN